MTLPDKDTFATYGGVKFDFIDVVDPTTDRSAAEINAALASLSMMTRTIPRAICRFDLAFDTNSYDFGEVNYHEAVWGNTLDVEPTIERDGYGVFFLNYPETVIDALNEEHTVAFKAVTASYDVGVGTTPKIGFSIGSAVINNTVRFVLFNAATGLTVEPYGPGGNTLTITCVVY